MDLPNDIVLEILSRFPLDEATKIQALSKSYNKTSYSSYYKTLLSQRQHGLISDGFLLQTLKSNANVLSFVSSQPTNVNSPPLDLSLSFLPGRNPRVRAIAPNGLLLCETQHPIHHNKYFYTITKLSTKQWKRLPNPKTRFFTQNMAIHITCSNPLHFKILRLSQDQIPPKRPRPFSYTICEVFDSKLWRWKRLDDIVHDSDSGFVESHCAAIFAHGSVHWKFSNETSIFAFDFLSETWSKVAMPDTIINEHEETIKNDSFKRWHTKLVEYEGNLGVMQEFDRPHVLTKLWVMEDCCHKRIWTKIFDILEPMPMTFYGSNILITWLYNGDVKLSNIETGESSCKKVEESHHSVPITMLPFLSDFKKWNLNPPPPSLSPKIRGKKHAQEFNL